MTAQIIPFPSPASITIDRADYGSFAEFAAACLRAQRLMNRPPQVEMSEFEQLLEEEGVMAAPDRSID